jgi:acetoin utilization deacetylase AcuC-like enzyme
LLNKSASCILLPLALQATSDLDIRLPDGCDDAKYLSTLADTLNSLLESVRPDLVLYDAGEG